MNEKPHEAEHVAELRARAAGRLSGDAAPNEARLSSIAAYTALYELVLSPETAPRALALLHELQVHQVEIDIQNEELHASRAALESILQRQSELYDQSPAALFTVDGTLELKELNWAGARALGEERDALVGRHLDAYLAVDSARTLLGAFVRLDAGGPSESCTLHLAGDGGRPGMPALARADCVLGQYLVAVFADAPHPAGSPMP